MALDVNGQPPAFVPNVQLLYSFQSVAGYDSLHTARYEDFWAAVDPTVRPVGTSTPYADVFIRPQAHDSRQASLLSARYVASPAPLVNSLGLRQVYSGAVAIYENAAALPRAFTVGSTVVVPHDELLAELGAPGFDPKEVVLLEAESAPSIPDTGGRERVYRQARSGLLLTNETASR